MISEPEKPKNYHRDYAVICVLALLIAAVLIYFQVQYVTVIIPVAFVTIVPLLWFREYYKAQREYLDKKIEAKNKEQYQSQSDVNQNIENYVAAQRLKRANKKWWQFWV
jgi:ABC-type bacteriocin/lantibiotic exporter with double-glycine peptidase domain